MLNWHTKQVNDIPSNPLDCYWAIGQIGNSKRLYTIIEQYPSKDGYTIESDTKPELYILFEALDSAVTTESDKFAEKFGDSFFKSRGSFIRAFRTLDEAKVRAEIQIKVIQNILDSYFPG